MFLTLLNKNLKQPFLSLAIKASESDATFDDVQHELITSFAKELDIEPFYSCEKSETEVISQIVNFASKTEKQIILFEIIGILYSDNLLQEAESDFLCRVSSGFNIDLPLANEMINLVADYKHLYIDICEKVLKESDSLEQ